MSGEVEVVERRFRVNNPRGLHHRPAASLVTVALTFDSDIFLVKEGMEVSGKSLLEVIMLEALEGTELLVRAVGDDAQSAVLAVGKEIEKAVF